MKAKRQVAGFWGIAPRLAVVLLVVGFFVWAIPTALRDPDRSGGDWLAEMMSGPITGLITFGGLYGMFLVTRRADREDEREKVLRGAVEAFQRSLHECRTDLAQATAADTSMKVLVRDLGILTSTIGSSHYRIGAWAASTLVQSRIKADEGLTQEAVDGLGLLSLCLVLWTVRDYDDNGAIDDVNSFAPDWLDTSLT